MKDVGWKNSSADKERAVETWELEIGSTGKNPAGT